MYTALAYYYAHKPEIDDQLQEARSLAGLQVPEPWSGDLEGAPILFLSSNPSISTAELYPRWKWPDEEIAGFFGRRFSGGRMGGNRERRKEGKGEEVDMGAQDLRG